MIFFFTPNWDTLVLDKSGSYHRHCVQISLHFKAIPEYYKYGVVLKNMCHSYLNSISYLMHDAYFVQNIEKQIQ